MKKKTNPVLIYRTKVFFVGEENRRGYCEGSSCPAYYVCGVPWKYVPYVPDTILTEWGYGD